MSCSPFDLKDYFLQELADPQRRQVEAHVKTCQPCREELDRLRLMEAALFVLREEEIPQRIAFVSDPVFEPSPWRRAFSAFWNSGARLGFASAAMLSAALVVFAMHRPAPAPVVTVAPTSVQTASASGMTEAEVQTRIDSAVAKALAPIEARQKAQLEQVKADLDGARQRLILAAQEFDYNHKKEGAGMITAGVYVPAGVGEPK